MDRKTIEERLTDAREVRSFLETAISRLNDIETDLDKWASELPEEESTF